MRGLRCARGGLGWIKYLIIDNNWIKKNILRKGSEVLEQADQGGGGTTITEGFQETYRCCTAGYDLVVWWWWVDG